jgi:DNA-binding NarL/FixJ family response regulator
MAGELTGSGALTGDAQVVATVASQENPLTVVVVDDHELFSAGLEFVLNHASQGCVRVVGRTTDAGQALDLVRRQRPRVAIIDLSMPPPGGVEAIRQVKHAYPQVAVLALSGTDDLDFATSALKAGADGFMLKSAAPEVLIPPLLSIALGVGVMPRAMMTAVFRTQRVGRDVLSQLDAEERQLWLLVAKGLDTNDIADRMFSSERTVKRMVAALLRKIGAANRHEASALAGRCGLLDDLEGHPTD